MIDYKNMKIGFLLFEKIHGKKYMGSSRIRGHWIVKYWDEAELFEQGKKYDTIIFQKVYWSNYLKVFGGVRILDICDPDWLDTLPIIEPLEYFDGVTTSTKALAEEIRKFTDKPVKYIADRQDLEFHNVQKVHRGIARKVIWFGYSHNAKTLNVALSYLKKYNLKLTVLSEFKPPYTRAHKNLKYNWGSPDFDFNEIILQHDIVLLPPDTRPRGKFKSKNKTYTAWALGMPVASIPEDLKRFLSAEERKKEAEKGLKEVREKWDVKISVEEFKEFIKELWKLRKER